LRRADAALIAVVYQEVSNTFATAQLTVSPTMTLRPDRADASPARDEDFHVSPFSRSRRTAVALIFAMIISGRNRHTRTTAVLIANANPVAHPADEPRKSVVFAASRASVPGARLCARLHHWQALKPRGWKGGAIARRPERAVNESRKT